jgi:hypothetical protein
MSDSTEVPKPELNETPDGKLAVTGIPQPFELDVYGNFAHVFLTCEVAVTPVKMIDGVPTVEVGILLRNGLEDVTTGIINVSVARTQALEGVPPKFWFNRFALKTFEGQRIIAAGFLEKVNIWLPGHDLLNES